MVVSFKAMNLDEKQPSEYLYQVSQMWIFLFIYF